MHEETYVPESWIKKETPNPEVEVNEESEEPIVVNTVQLTVFQTINKVGEVQPNLFILKGFDTSFETNDPIMAVKAFFNRIR